MGDKREFVKKVAQFLAYRCEGLGYIPVVSRVLPINRSFLVQPGPDAVFVKVFGHFGYNINVVQGRFAVLDPDNLKELGGLGEDNLALTETEKFLLVAEILKIPFEDMQKVAKNSKSLADLFEIWKTQGE